MNYRDSFELNDLKFFASVFDKSLLKHVQNLKSPDKRIKKAMIYFIKTGGKRIGPFLIHKTGTFMGIDRKILNDFSFFPILVCINIGLPVSKKQITKIIKNNGEIKIRIMVDSIRSKILMTFKFASIYSLILNTKSIVNLPSCLY